MTMRNTTQQSRPPGRHSPSMSEHQLQAYLLARDTVRRIQRTAALFGNRPPVRPSQSSPTV